MQTSLYRAFGKRLFDVLLAGSALILLAPLILIVAGLVRLKLGSPILFRQQRPGLNETPFILYKFRTMLDERDDQGNVLSEAERITPFGRLLRSTSLDELPGLINVLKGEMSVIGPRPLLMKYLNYYTPRQRRRHEVKPGITGLAQSKGRNALTWEQRFNFDVWYVGHYSFGLDLQILLLTLQIVLKREGITHETHSSMPEFSGVAGSVEQA